MFVKPRANVVAYAVLPLFWFLSVASAQASLGRGLTSVEGDAAALGAKHVSVTTAAYTAHTLDLPNGGTVKEFARPDGAVFALVWRAPGRPDLRQLLGDHFDAMQAAPAVSNARHLRRPVGVSNSTLVVQTGGHPGAFWGAAMLPQMQPAGFSASDLK